MNASARLGSFVGKRAIAGGMEVTITAVHVDSRWSEIEQAINNSKFTVRLNSGGSLTLPGRLFDVIDDNSYLIPEDCPWIEAPNRSL